ncbi:glycosyl hydrolase family 17 protein [Cecembia lonarensis]|uniref:Endo-1,3-beta-glucanase btgC n=1 Tax=Cecembia lonarensis (strain CCUG 58316 / KCTC 22772 / LW9) TaxID=1225176 RepID=K1LKJ4_CECL9|nr:glycosyl hydrolase family 17 protein [Cecembia lonarensis]EKB50888.1 Exo-beta-1,3-glucanase [Cecembia lonarensis LW9]
MSFNPDKILALAGKDLQGFSNKELSELFRSTLKEGMPGLCFSPYEDGQQPGDQLSEEQIRRRLNIIRPYTQWVRSFSCTDGNELIPKIAKEYGIKTLVGAWLGKDDEINQKEVKNLIQLAKDGYVDIAAVGNEVMYRKDLSEDQLLEFIHQVKSELPDIPVGYVDAYYEFERKPRITDACDVILANCYPYWEGCALDYSLLYIKDMYARAVRSGNGKKVIITETGWPSQGTALYGAVPSDENFIKYFINIQKWSKEESIDIHYFSSFDEAWKVGAEGDVGAYWGLWDKDEDLKY